MANVNPRIKWHGTAADAKITSAPAGVIGWLTDEQCLIVFHSPVPGNFERVVSFEGLERVSTFPLFASIKTGHILNNASYVNGRLFSWLSGAVYTSAYNELVNEKNNSTTEQKTQTIAGVTITYYLTATNKKICLPDQADNVASLYTATGAADFYLLDTENQQFKLPRRNARRLLRAYKNGDEWYNLYSDGWIEQGGITKSGTAVNNNFTQSFLVGMADTHYNAKGTYTPNSKASSYLFVPDELYGMRTQTSAVFRLDSEDNYWSIDNNNYLTWEVQGYADTSLIQDEFEYEYFFLGTSVNETSVDVGQITTALTGKADMDLSNAVPAKSFTSQSAAWAMPSDSYVDLTLAPSGSTYTAPANGYVFIAKASGAARQYVSVGIKDASGQSVIEDYNLVSSTTQNLTILFPISKGATYVIGYNATGATNFFRFIYAQGEI